MYLLAQIRAAPGLRRRAAHIHLTPCGHSVGTPPLLPFSAPGQRCGSWHQGHPCRSETWGAACSYNAGNTGRGGPWPHQDRQWHPEGKEPLCSLKTLSFSVFFLRGDIMGRLTRKLPLRNNFSIDEICFPNLTLTESIPSLYFVKSKPYI
uniref:Uncharacterized protein n=1 Tax=Molossus molossus TaxID=27622 RepID=A0A7J8GQF0_MOLMO|nr:hypothetical protein HJG59_011375 [Molossus molossus]